MTYVMFGCLVYIHEAIHAGIYQNFGYNSTITITPTLEGQTYAEVNTSRSDYSSMMSIHSLNEVFMGYFSFTIALINMWFLYRVSKK